MESYALFIGATLSAFTVLAIAVRALPSNWRAGIVNLGLKGLVPPSQVLPPWCTTGNTWLSFAGMVAGHYAAIFGVLVILACHCSRLV